MGPGRLKCPEMAGLKGDTFCPVKFTATSSASQIATSHWVDCSCLSRVFLFFFRVFCLNKCTWRVWWHLAEMLTSWSLILLLLEVLTGQDGQGSSNSELFAEAVGMAMRPWWPGLEGPLEWRHYWADGLRPYLKKYSNYAKENIVTTYK